MTETATKLWRLDRPHEPSGDREPEIISALPMHGIARVPLVDEQGVLVASYNDQTKTYDYHFIGHDDRERWRRTLPMGAYGQSVVASDRDEFCVPNSFTKYTALSKADGSILWEAELGSRLRSSAGYVGEGYIVFIGNKIRHFDQGEVTSTQTVPGAMFFGNPVVNNGSVYTLAGLRTEERAYQALYRYDLVSKSIAWVTEVGPDYVPASDTAGATFDPVTQNLVVGNSDGTVVAIDSVSGEVDWRTSLSEPEMAVRSAVAAAEGCVVVCTIEGGIYVLDSVTGLETASAVADPLGVWSTPSIIEDDVYVHAGAWLKRLRIADLSVKWELPIGFNAYTAPVIAPNGNVFICGGDPPGDGYLLEVPTESTAQKPDISATYTIGDAKDYLEITYRPDTTYGDVELDLRFFGRSEHERMLPSGPGELYWAGEVAQHKRYAEVVIYGIGIEGAVRRSFTFSVDTGSDHRPESVAARTLGNAELPKRSEIRENSGGPVLAAVLASYGREVDPVQVEEAAQYIASRGVDPHHIWRGGSGRILAASGLPLRESEGVPTGKQDVLEVIDRWESAQSSS